MGGAEAARTQLQRRERKAVAILCTTNNQVSLKWRQAVPKSNRSTIWRIRGRRMQARTTFYMASTTVRNIITRARVERPSWALHHWPTHRLGTSPPFRMRKPTCLRCSRSQATWAFLTPSRRTPTASQHRRLTCSRQRWLQAQLLWIQRRQRISNSNSSSLSSKLSIAR